MQILQLNPTIPVYTEKGSGEAWFLIDYGKEDHLHWVVAIDETSEIWVIPNPKVRAFKNWTLDRLKSTLDEKN